jgi:hypothetical protein
MAAACGEGGLGDSSCELAASISGEVEWSSSRAPACAIPFGGDTGILMLYLPLGEPIAGVTVDVDEVTEGETGTFPATVEVRHEDDREWTATACTVTIDEHSYQSEDDFSKEYLATGSGECASPAEPTGGDATGTVTVEPFAFRFAPHW